MIQLHHVLELIVLTAACFFSLGVMCEAHRTLRSGDVHNIFAEDEYEIRRNIAGCTAIFLFVVLLGLGYQYLIVAP